ncbi:MAG: hypothetical protein IPM56_03020 [Ignavibacteriales bacterium]|nr:MAG: hypothetical protein IPM56_03020 [Ignavibacteriales bacterium]
MTSEKVIEVSGLSKKFKADSVLGQVSKTMDARNAGQERYGLGVFPGNF